MNDSPYDVMHVSSQPHLSRGTLVLAFSGWMDGGDVSTGTVKRLVELTTARSFAEIDPELRLPDERTPIELRACLDATGLERLSAFRL